jgi:hypothetical protein
MMRHHAGPAKQDFHVPMAGSEFRQILKSYPRNFRMKIPTAEAPSPEVALKEFSEKLGLAHPISCGAATELSPSVSWGISSTSITSPGWGDTRNQCHK